MADMPINTDSEIWKDIPGWDGYQASSLGKIRSVDRVRMQKQYGTLAPVLYKGQMRSQSQCPQTGYMKVGLTQPGKRKRTWCVNVLVCMAFHGPCPHEGWHVRHRNGVRTSNEETNLCWASPAVNAADRKIHGTNNHGERNGQAKLTENQVREIRRKHKNGTMPTALGLEYGLNPRHVCDIVAGRRWNYLE